MKDTKGVKTNKGITLIALIITIVLMLSLASVSVSIVINGGLFEHAGQAKYSAEIANEREKIQEAYLFAENISKTGNVTVDDLRKEINKVLGENVATVLDNNETIVVKVNESNRYYEVDNTGKVIGPQEIIFDSTPGELEGTGTEDNPYVIMSIEDLVFFSQQVNSGTKDYAGEYVELGKTLDFKSDLSYSNINTTDYDEFLGGDGETGLKEQLAKGLGFYPIGEYKSNGNFFEGNFEGNGNWIKNIYINKELSYVALFARSFNMKVQNLNISGEITGLENVGSIFGGAQKTDDDVKIINCNSYVNVTGTKSVGGIAGNGLAVNVENCTNYGTIKVTETSGTNVGGIIGVNGEIKDCTNYGIVNGPMYVGGICGNANDGWIFECVNAGAVKGVENVGGICGTSGNAGAIHRCYNSGDVTGEVAVGGIAGHHYRKGLINCAYNIGNVNGTTNVGGIAGDCSDSWGRSFISSKCYNTGSVTGTTNVGQVIGKLSTTSSAYYEKMYYLNTSSSKGIGNMDDIDGIVEGKDTAELKADDLLSVLNASHTHTINGTEVDYTSNCWVQDTNKINSGYPIFTWQTQADNSQ